MKKTKNKNRSLGETLTQRARVRAVRLYRNVPLCAPVLFGQRGEGERRSAMLTFTCWPRASRGGPLTSTLFSFRTTDGINVFEAALRQKILTVNLNIHTFIFQRRTTATRAAREEERTNFNTVLKLCFRALLRIFVSLNKLTGTKDSPPHRLTLLS